MSLLSDGSQARKTNDEKELVLVRVERGGLPIYLVVSLLQMASRGGTDADSIKLALDSIFSEDNSHANDPPGPVAMPQEQYLKKLVSATADGASVNMGIYNGVVTQFQNERPWLVPIHCVNHRVGLAIKDTVKEIASFEKCDRFYTTIYFLFKNSGKLKSEAEKASDALNITHYPLPKIYGTRFINHRRRGFTNLIHIWPLLITTFDNARASQRGYRGETKANIIGIAKKLHNFKFLCKVAAYLDFLEKLAPLSLMFERDLLMSYEVEPAVDQILDQLQEMADESPDNNIDSFLKKFVVRDEYGLATIEVGY